MAKELNWTQAARKDFHRCLDIIARDSPEAAEKWALLVLESAERLLQFPEMGREVPELPSFLELIIGKNYRLIYRIRKDKIYLSRLLHARQDFRTAWRGRP